MTKNVSYTLFDPTGNMTILAETAVPTASQPLIAKKLMRLEPTAEQVGFVSEGPSGICLRMAGGEFCGNAAMSTAALYLLRQRLQEGYVTVHVAGTKEPVSVEMASREDGSFRGTVVMPRPLSVKRERMPDGSTLPVVRFPGIAHAILEAGTMQQIDAEENAPAWCDFLGADALGLMFLNGAHDRLKPLVYVPEAGTMFWESSCASGTTAVGAFLAAESGMPVQLKLMQPGGTLEIAAEPAGALRLSGTVRKVRRAVNVTL